MRLLRTLVLVASGLAAPCAFACGAREAPRESGVDVSHLYYVLPAGESPGALYFAMTNNAATADTLTAIESAPGVMVMIHGPMPAMQAISAIEIAPGATERLAPGIRHGMVSAPLEIGRAHV